MAQEREGQRGLERTRSGLPAPASPFTFMRRFAEQMDRLFDDLGFGSPEIQLRSGEQGWTPQLEVFEREGRLVVRADLPGMQREDVTVEVTPEGLVIEGERRQEHERQNEGYYRSERHYGRFTRVIPLPEGAEAEQAHATFRDGVLEVTVPMAKTQSRRHRIEIGEGGTPATGGPAATGQTAASTKGAASTYTGEPLVREAQKGTGTKRG